MKLFFLFFFAISSISIFAQPAIPFDSTTTLKKIKISETSRVATFMETNSPILLGIGLGQSANTAYNKGIGSGIIADLGINFGAFIHPSLKVGAFVGFKSSKRLFGKPAATSGFKDNFNANFIADQNLSDTSRSDHFSLTLNSSANTLLGDYYTIYGVFFKYPNAYAPLVKLYAGKRRMVFKPERVNVNFEETDRSIIYKVPINLGVEMVWEYKNAGLGFFVEKSSYDNATLTDLRFDKFLKSNFFTQKDEMRWGARFYFYPWEWYRKNKDNVFGEIDN